jgi:hypothetical protein
MCLLWLVFSEGVVGVTVQPTFTNFGGSYHRMTTHTRVLRSMLVWRTVATASRATLLARAQMKPGISRLNALIANSIFWLFDIGNPIDVNAYLCCHVASIQFAGDNPLDAAEQA